MGRQKQTELVDAIRLAANSGIDYLPLIRAKVKSVDEDKYTVTAVAVADGDAKEAPEFEASLRSAVVNGDLGFIPVPEIDSIVILGFVHNSREQAGVISCSQISKLIITAGVEIETKIDGSTSGKIKVTSSGIDFGAASEPVVLGDTLKSWCEQVDAALSAIIAWGATGVAPTTPDPGPGGIAPLTGASAPSFPAGALSTKHKVD